MLAKLKEFKGNRSSDLQQGGFFERLRFFIKENDRSICLRKIRRWNKDLEKEIREACQRSTERNTTRNAAGFQDSNMATNAAIPITKNASYANLRTRSARLFTAWSRCWS